jgi:hypothetical protein
MSQSVKLPDELCELARRHAAVNSRSLAKQIEFWARIGKMAEDNPDLPYGFIRDSVISRQESQSGELTEYRPG